MLVTSIEPRPLRSLERVRVPLGPGIVSVVGPNGVGKTNLVEALYFALTGRSFRTADRRDLIPFGASLARAEATVRDEDGIERRLLASVSRAEGHRSGTSAEPGPGCPPGAPAPGAAPTSSTAAPPTRRRSPAPGRRWRS